VFSLTSFPPTACVPFLAPAPSFRQIRVPFVTSLSYFTVYRPGDIIGDADDLAVFYALHKNSC
jgi:hypothetical protein